jgi:hypothetical protein
VLCKTSPTCAGTGRRRLAPLPVLLGALSLCILFPSAKAWEEDPVLEFVMAYSPLIRTHKGITQTYLPAGGFTERLYQNTQLYAQAGIGGTEFQAEQGVTLIAGARINIPLASSKEQREFAEKLAGEAEKIDAVRKTVIADMAELRQREAQLMRVQTEHDFWEAKSQWLQERVEKGYEEIDKLWDIGQKLNESTASLIEIDLLIQSQRRTLAQHAGAQAAVLQHYLAGEGAL